MARYSGTVKHLAAVAAAALCLSAVPSIVGSAAADGHVVLDREAKMESCNGVGPTGGSENTIKDLAEGSDLNPGGEVTFQVSYPNSDEVDSGEYFVLTDCFGVVDANGDMTQELDKFEITFTPNSQNLSFEYELQIPDGLPIGTQLCNWVKTTADPSAAQGSNRKGDVCFSVGGSLRVEKHDDEGNSLWGAKFTVQCEDAAAAPDVVISGLEDAFGSAVTGNPVTGYLNEQDGIENAIAIAGEEGAECTVTELQAPAGYVTPVGDDAVHVYEIGRGDAPESFAIVNEAVAPTYGAVTTTTTPSGTFDRTTSWSLAKTVDDAQHSGDAGADAGTSEWTVTATKSVSAPSNYALSGQTVSVSNPNPIAVDGSMGVTVGGTSVAVDCDPGAEGAQTTLTVPAKSGDTNGSADCTYGGAASAASDQVVATFTATVPALGDSHTTGVNWTAYELGPQSLSVEDDRAPAGVLPETVTATQTWTYEETFACPSEDSAYDDEDSYTETVTNTATATGLEPASASVVVNCSIIRVLPTNPTSPPGTDPTTDPSTDSETPTVLPFVPDAAAPTAPTALPRTGADYLLPMLALGLGGLLIGALLVGAGRRRDA